GRCRGTKLMKNDRKWDAEGRDEDEVEEDNVKDDGNKNGEEAMRVKENKPGHCLLITLSSHLLSPGSHLLPLQVNS
ncbi:hypothetical protein U1Q18_000608, partial [Sarracenia purpurea var. burkii]